MVQRRLIRKAVGWSQSSFCKEEEFLASFELKTAFKICDSGLEYTMRISHAISVISLFVSIFATTEGFNIPQNPNEAGVSKHQRVLEDDVGYEYGRDHGLGHSDEKEKGKKLHLSAVLNESDPPFNAIVQCWELSPSFVSYPTTGQALSLGDTANATYVVLPPRGGEGWHRPPSPM